MDYRSFPIFFIFRRISHYYDEVISIRVFIRIRRHSSLHYWFGSLNRLWRYKFDIFGNRDEGNWHKTSLPSIQHRYGVPCCTSSTLFQTVKILKEKWDKLTQVDCTRILSKFLFNDDKMKGGNFSWIKCYLAYDMKLEYFKSYHPLHKTLKQIQFECRRIFDGLLKM